LQWQILKVIGVPPEERGEYVLRKFKRGNQVEEWLADYMIGLINRQKFVEYKNTVGWVDAIVDMKDWNLDFGVIPHEIKSVSNIKYKRVQKAGPDEAHILQACLYAMALKSDHFALDYVAADDYRTETYLFKTEEYSPKVETVIESFNHALESKMVPTFLPLLDWHNIDEYNSYKAFKALGPIEIDEVLKEKYPEAYKKLKGGDSNV
jgi:CRISPR/Cas system-associated exonuclease Cas4 (RecB family)